MTGLAPPPALTDGEAAGLFLGDSAVLQQQGSNGLGADGANGRATRGPQDPSRQPGTRLPAALPLPRPSGSRREN